MILAMFVSRCGNDQTEMMNKAESRYQTCVSRQLRKLLYDLIYFFNIVNPNVPMSPLGNTSKLFTVHINDSSLY